MQRRSNFHREAGNSMWTIMLILAVAGFILTIIFTIAPAFVSNCSVKGVIDAMVSEPGLGKLSNAEIRSALERRFDINNVDVIKATCRKRWVGKYPCVKLERTRDTLTIDASYEARVHVMGNVDAVITFDGNVVVVPIVSD